MAKRILACFLAILMLTSLLTVSASAATYIASGRPAGNDQDKVLKVAKATPTLDGVMDDAYLKSEMGGSIIRALPLEGTVPNADRKTALADSIGDQYKNKVEVWYLWDDNYVYAYARIYDYNLSQGKSPSKTDLNTDCFNFLIDFDDKVVLNTKFADTTGTASDKNALRTIIHYTECETGCHTNPVYAYPTRTQYNKDVFSGKYDARCVVNKNFTDGWAIEACFEVSDDMKSKWKANEYFGAGFQYNDDCITKSGSNYVLGADNKRDATLWNDNCCGYTKEADFDANKAPAVALGKCILLPEGSSAVNITTSASEGGTVPATAFYGSHAPITLTATPKTGYRFVNWTEGSQVVSTSAAYTFTPAANRNLKANFERIPYTINAYAAGIGSITGTTGTVYHGDTVTLTAVPNQGYYFVNWTENGQVVGTDEVLSFTAAANRNLTANFAKATVQYNITATGVNATVTGAGLIPEGRDVTLTATPVTGTIFVGWFENDQLVSSSPVFTFRPTADRTLVAKAKITFDIVVAVEGNGVVTGAGAYADGETVTLVADPDLKNHFVGWYEAGQKISEEKTLTFTADGPRNLIAVFEADKADSTMSVWLAVLMNRLNTTYEILVTGDSGADLSTEGINNVRRGKSLTVDIKAKEGYIVTDVLVNGKSVGTPSSYTFKSVKGDYVIEVITSRP